MTKTTIVLVLVTVGMALNTLVDQVPAADVLFELATNWMSSIAAVARCPSAPGLGGGCT